MKELIKEPVRLLVTHMNPDMDAIGACWLFMKFDEQDFSSAELYFVSAGEEIENDVLYAKNLHRDEVVHVDTGMGPFDHHQPGHTEKDSATMLVYEYLCKKYPDYVSDEALRRVVQFINDTDHFSSYWWPEPTDDRYIFELEEILAGLRSGRHFNDRELVEFGMVCYDGVYTSMRVRVSAEEEIKELGREFESPWGKALAIQNQNDEVIKLAQKMGYQVVVRKDEERGNIRIKCAPKDEINLQKVYEEIVNRDKEGTWYNHPSGHMLINGSRKHIGQKASPLSLDEVVEIVKQFGK